MSAAKPDTWMPLYWGDYLRDTAHLSAAEHGAYLLMIGHYWTSGQPLPDEEARLARIARMTQREWRASRCVLAEFFTIADGVWRHGRVDKELGKATSKTEAKAEAGRLGAERRWGKGGKSDGTAMAHPSKNAWQTDAPSQPPSDTPTGVGVERAPRRARSTHAKPDSLRLGLEVLPDSWRKWAVSEGHSDPDKAWARFSDHWRSKPGRDGESADWQAKWRNWVRDDVAEAGSKPATTNGEYTAPAGHQMDRPGKAESEVEKWIANGGKGFWPDSYGPPPGDPRAHPRVKAAWDAANRNNNGEGQ